jgi:hypothetical protein
MHLDQLRVLVAQHEFEQAVLPGLDHLRLRARHAKAS